MDLVLVEVTADYCPVEVSPGVVRFADRGETLEILASDAERHLPYGHVRLVEALKPVATADEHNAELGEAVGTDADEPLPAADDAESLRAYLDAAGVEFDKRFGVKKLRKLVEAHRAAAADE